MQISGAISIPSHSIYDHRTRRVVRDESGISGRTRDMVIYSGGTSVQEHEGESGATPANAANPDMEYIRGSDWGGGVGGILYTSRAGVVSWAHYNGRGDVVTRTSGTGSLTYAASYEAFGTRTQEAGTNPDRQRANTKEEDPTGLLNEGHRYRDLELGMFISRDPAGFVDGPNVYTYVVQNPWSSFDPEGLQGVGYGGNTRQPSFLEAAFPAHARAMNAPGRPMPSRTGDFRSDVAHSRVLQSGLASGTVITGAMYAGVLAGTTVGLPVAGAVKGALVRTVNKALQNPEAAIGIGTGIAETVAGVDGPGSVPDLGDVNKAVKATAEMAEQAVGSSTARQTVKEGMTRVGRWMHELEYAKMKQTQQVQEGGGGLTFASTSGPDSFRGRATPGQIYVEYDVPTNSLIPGGQADWVKNVGPNAPGSQLARLEKQGGETLPKVENLTEPLEKKAANTQREKPPRPDW